VGLRRCRHAGVVTGKMRGNSAGATVWEVGNMWAKNVGLPILKHYETH